MPRRYEYLGTTCRIYNIVKSEQESKSSDGYVSVASAGLARKFSICKSVPLRPSCSSVIVRSSLVISNIPDSPTSTTDSHWDRSSTVRASSTCVPSWDRISALKSRGRIAGPKALAIALLLIADELTPFDCGYEESDGGE